MITTEIVSDLTIGSFTDLAEMHKNGWKCMCFARTDVPEYCKHIPLNDGGGNDPAKIEFAINYIIELWKQHEKVFVCCRHGRNRSVLIAAGALAVQNRVRWMVDGLRIIASKRSFISPRDDTLADVANVVAKMRIAN